MFICDLHRGGKDDTHYMDKKAFPKWIDTGFSMDQKVAFMDEYVFFSLFLLGDYKALVDIVASMPTNLRGHGYGEC